MVEAGVGVLVGMGVSVGKGKGVGAAGTAGEHAARNNRAKTAAPRFIT
jgi:hypothetical protein